VQLRPEPFSAAEINSIFGPHAKISPQMGNRVLSVLQGRRVDGTLDLDLPADITRSVRSQALDAGLNWLRANYPLDEDAAILARIEREEKEEQEKLIRRAEELGLYKPQSGSYGAELGDENDPYGKSVLKEAREKNEARLLAEQERKRREWLEGEEQEREKLKRMIQKNTALQKFEESAALEGEYFAPWNGCAVP
jgi:rhomboid-like protein